MKALLSTAVALAVAGLAAAADAQDEYFNNASHLSAETGSYDAAMVREIVRQTVAEMHEYGDVTSDAACRGCDAGCCCDACCCSRCCLHYGWDFGVEVAYLKPHFAPGGPASVDVEAAVNAISDYVEIDLDGPEYDYEASPRIWIGYMGCQDWGWRVRYWNFDHTSELLDASVEDLFGDLIRQTGIESLSIDVVDLEFLFQGSWCNWGLLGSAGARYAKLQRYAEERFFDPDPQPIDFVDLDDLQFEGYGPTLSLEARRCVWCGITPFVTVRTSLLAGQFGGRELSGEDFGDFLGFTTTEIDEEFNTLWVNEIQVGAEWARCTRYGQLYVRAALEGQNWVRAAAILDSTSSGRAENFGDLTLVGGTFSIGLRR